MVFDESVFPFSTTTTTPTSTTELDLSSVFPIDPVVEPPLPLFPVLLRRRLPVTPGAGTLPGPRGATFWTGPCARPGPDSGPTGTLRPAGACLPATCPRCGSRTDDSDPTGTLRLADARLPAMCPAGAAAYVGIGGPLFAGVTYAISNVFSTGDTESAAEDPSYQGRDAGVPSSASLPTPASCSFDGDTTRGWYPTAPGSCGDARGLAGLPGALFRPRGFAGPSLAPRDGRGVRGPPRQLDLGSSPSSAELQHRHRQVDLDPQALG